MQPRCDSWVRYLSYLYHGLHNTRNVSVLVCSKEKRRPPALAYVYNPSFLKTPTLSHKSDNSNSSIVRRFPAQVQPWFWICPLLLHRCGLWWNKPQSSFLLEKKREKGKIQEDQEPRERLENRIWRQGEFTSGLSYFWLHSLVRPQSRASPLQAAGNAFLYMMGSSIFFFFFHLNPGFREIQSWLGNKSIWEDKGHLGNGFWQPLWHGKKGSSSFSCFAPNMFVILFLCQLLLRWLGWGEGVDDGSLWIRLSKESTKSNNCVK